MCVCACARMHATQVVAQKNVIEAYIKRNPLAWHRVAIRPCNRKCHFRRKVQSLWILNQKKKKVLASIIPWMVEPKCISSIGFKRPS